MSEPAFSVPAKGAHGEDGAHAVGALAAIFCATPALAVIAAAATYPLSTAALGASTPALFGTVLLVAVAGCLAALIGAAAAALISFCRFPGRDVFEWALIIPLAAPPYVLAYAYGGLTGPGGPAPLPWMSGAIGAGLVYVLAFYPYVYLAARAAFATGSQVAWEAARCAGAGPIRALLHVIIPLAWPGIAAGAALAMMEIASDYGVARYFGATTLTTDIFRAWFSRGDIGFALQLASLLLIGAMAMLWLERTARGQRRYAGGSQRAHAPSRLHLTGAALWGAIAYCTILIALAAIAPLGWYFSRAFLTAPSEPEKLIAATANSVLIAGLGAAATLALSLMIAAVAQRRSGKLALFAAAAGYAAPGAVMALGLLAVLGFAREGGWIGGLGAGLSLSALIWIYAARFASAGAQPIEAGLTRVTPSIHAAARVLGAPFKRRFTRIALPMAAPSVLVAGLMVFVEIIKELPATLILRPFDFDTLAVIAHAYANDERLVQAALPSLLLTLVGLAPVLLLSRRIETTRIGAAAAGPT